MSEQCSFIAFSGSNDDMRGYRCRNNAKLDGLCTIHQPEYIRKRNAESSERYRIKQENSVYGLLKKAKARIAELEAPQWIAVEDELPEKWGTQVEFLIAVEGQYVKPSWYEGDGVWDYTGVTHWMKLPTPPEPKQ